MLHDLLVPTAGGSTINHVDWEKTDNRLENLLVCSRSDQSMNRAMRCDKKRPPAELVALGIEYLPRRLRWDVGETKFVVEMQNSVISGTKSAKVSLINKFRDSLDKLISTVHEDLAEMDVVGTRARLANEYNQIVKAANTILPDIFPEAYADIEAICGELAYCRSCRDKLPAPTDGEVLRGYLNVESNYMMYPSISTLVVIRSSMNESRYIFFDEAHESLVKKLPSIDVSGGTPFVYATQALKNAYKELGITLADVNRKKKIMVKDIVYMCFMGLEKPEGYTIVPLDYQQYDLRSANLRALLGEPKMFKPPEVIPLIPTEVPDLNMRFWPRDVSLAMTGGGSAKSPWTLYVRSAAGKKRFSCSATTIAKIFRDGVLPLLASEEEDFDAWNARYQQLLGQYVDIVYET